VQRAFSRFVGVDLGGARGKTTAVAELRGTASGVEVIEVATRAGRLPWTDDTLIGRLAVPDPDRVIAVDAPLTSTACGRCEEPVCPGMEACVDPAVVWLAVARSLAGARRFVHALDAARSAIDLAGPATLAAALDVAIAASRALGRDAQAAGLAAQRARVAPAGGTLGDRDPTDARAALDAHRERASSATAARLWVASRWNPATTRRDNAESS